MVTDTEFVLIVSIPDYTPRCYPLTQDHVKVGRGANNHLRLDNQAISSRHCEFSRDVDSGQWNFRDLESTNGSKSNGNRVSNRPVSLRDGDQILLGEEIRILFCKVRKFKNLELEEIEQEIEVNPVAAAVARQVREDSEGGLTVRLRESED
ncbi:MAG: FHA domain-containing protein [Verrucomicrobiales bacterium]|nr:FHA domain-containing protein [Verrucomicrobiales bacterium]